ncbi:MAG TPA: LytTR family transcriptional regulator DNA-binding domain-containing protein [Firmicutes bacterium]|nr:LytTR family transcriptional regulator DNA-binding domain-containing protein [Bacillota bacterium]
MGDKRLLRCYQSFLVNMDDIRQIDKQFLVSNGESLPIGRCGTTPVWQADMEYPVFPTDVF